MFLINSRGYEGWAVLIARLLLAIQFGVAAWFKIAYYSMEVAQTASVGVPLPSVAVILALILEMAGIVALLTGFKLRLLGGLLAPYVLLLAVLFYRDWSNQLNFGFFMSHLGLIAALLYVSVHGAGRFAFRRG